MAKLTADLRSPKPPRPGDMLFAHASDWWNNARLHWGAHSLDLYAIGFREAADFLVDKVNAEASHQDTIVFPVTFLYRHYLELRLKEIIQSGRRLLDQRGETPHEHDLGKLWKIARAVLERVELSGGSSVLDSIENLISQFCEVDPSSFAFRYPFDKSGQETLTQLGHINLRNLKEVMGTVADFLDGASTAISIDLDAKSQMLREWEP